jgi:hypothetical protein
MVLMRAFYLCLSVFYTIPIYSDLHEPALISCRFEPLHVALWLNLSPHPAPVSAFGDSP